MPNTDQLIAEVRKTRNGWPTPTEDEPDLDALESMAFDGIVDATDGCSVEPDGTCEHGHPSWLLQMGLI